MRIQVYFYIYIYDFFSKFVLIVFSSLDVEKAVMKLKQFFPNIEINGLDIGEVKVIHCIMDNISLFMKTLSLQKGANERLQKSLFDALGMKEKELQEASSWSFPALVRYLVLVQVLGFCSVFFLVENSSNKFYGFRSMKLGVSI